MTKQILYSDRAPRPIGPYSQGVVASGRWVFASGQIPIDPKTGEVVGEDITTQTYRVLANLEAVLQAAGASLSDVVMTTVYLRHWEDFAEMNRVYAEFFPENPPARACVEVSRLPKDVLLEMACVAVCPTASKGDA